MAYEKGELIKELDGVKAPTGFHYMPNGRLMSDAGHIATSGYIQKKIGGISIDTKDASYLGEIRPFKITGDVGAYFSVELFTLDSGGNPASWYNFYTEEWSTTVNGLKNIRLGKDGYYNIIKFQENTTSLLTYKLRLIAETTYNHKTSHTEYQETRNSDGSLNVNESMGSNSNILTRLIYQDVKKYLYLSCIAPSRYASIADTVDGSTSSSNRVVVDNDTTVYGIQNGDLINESKATWLVVDEVNPDGDNLKEIQWNTAVSLSDGATLTFLPSFNGVTPHSSDSTTGRHTIAISTGGEISTKFTITIQAPEGRVLSVLRTPTTKDLCTFKNVTFESAALAIPGEGGSSIYYRWPVTNIAGLQDGMQLDPARSGGGANTTTPATISPYITTETIQRFAKRDYPNILHSQTNTKEHIRGVDSFNNPITASDRNGVTTAQKGNLIFSKQQADALKSDSSVRIFGYGTRKIKSLTDGMSVSISDVEITPTKLSVTTSGATSASTTIPIASTDGGVENLSIGTAISGANIAAASANPTVVSKAANTGAANIVVSAAQTLESGQKLNIENRAKTLTITGNITVTDFPLSDTTIYLDLERFLTSI